MQCLAGNIHGFGVFICESKHKTHMQWNDGENHIDQPNRYIAARFENTREKKQHENSFSISRKK